MIGVIISKLLQWNIQFISFLNTQQNDLKKFHKFCWIHEYFENISLIKKSYCTLLTSFDVYTELKKAQVCSLSVYVYCYDRYTYNYDIIKINDISLLFSEENIQSKLKISTKFKNVLIKYSKFIKELFDFSVITATQKYPHFVHNLVNDFCCSKKKTMHIHEPFLKIEKVIYSNTL